MTHLAGVGVQTVSQSVLDAKAIQEIETTDLHKAIAPLIEFLCGAPVTPAIGPAASHRKLRDEHHRPALRARPGKQGLGKLPSGIRPPGITEGNQKIPQIYPAMCAPLCAKDVQSTKEQTMARVPAFRRWRSSTLFPPVAEAAGSNL